MSAETPECGGRCAPPGCDACDELPWITENAARARVFADIDTERARQHAKWGEQNHPMVANPHAPLQAVHGPYQRFEARTAEYLECRRLGIPSERDARDACSAEHREGRGTYASILVEELAEFVSACVTHGETSDEARAEMVQVAAVTVAMLECVDRRRAKGGAA